MAAAYNQVEIIEYLLQKGARIDPKDKDNFTPLLMAACEGNADAVRMLLDNNADMYAIDKEDKSALYWAAAQNHVEAAQVRFIIRFCFGIGQRKHVNCNQPTNPPKKHC